MNLRFLNFFALFTAFSTVLLLAAGALVTGTGSGLAVPDWPLSYGSLLPPMVGGILYEHGHRLVAGWVLILTLTQAILFQMKEPRAWVKRLAWGMFGIVMLQALLGGLTVIFRLPPQVSVAHACLAQIFFSSTIFISLVTSPLWLKAEPKIRFESQGIAPALPTFSFLLSIGFFIQLLFGATMRHLGAGLAIPDFPTVFGGILPPEWTTHITVHFIHRMGAVVLTISTAVLCAQIHKRYSSLLDLVALSGGLMALIFLQIFLGAMVIWLKRPIPFTTIHLVVGASCLALSVSLHALIRRHERVSSQGRMELQGAPA